jgi:hypothetical protein
MNIWFINHNANIHSIFFLFISNIEVLVFWFEATEWFKFAITDEVKIQTLFGNLIIISCYPEDITFERLNIILIACFIISYQRQDCPTR